MMMKVNWILPAIVHVRRDRTSLIISLKTKGSIYWPFASIDENGGIYILACASTVETNGSVDWLLAYIVEDECNFILALCDHR